MKTTLYFTLTLFAFVTLAFVPNSFAQGADYIVQVIYFHPNDIEPQEDSVNTLKTMMKDIQTFYADEMERHGYGRKTFRLETDENDNVILHHMKGNFDHTRYNDDIRSPNAMNEIESWLDFSKKIIYLIWVDRYAPDEQAGDVKGRAGGVSERGTTWIFPFNFDSSVWNVNRDAWTTIAHEIGHAFGLKHDFRNNFYIMSYGGSVRSELSSCAAKWLDAHKYFNNTVTPINDNASVQMLPTSPAEPMGIRLRFNISDTDGLHQVIYYYRRGEIELIECKQLSGHSSTVDFITFDSDDTSVHRLLIIDRYGNFRYHGFEVRPTDLLPPSEVVSIPDANLATTIRERLRLAPDSTITQLDMLRLLRFRTNRQITDLTGLEYATNLREFVLQRDHIKDLTPLSKLTNLTRIDLSWNQIEDLTPLSQLTNQSSLGHLYIENNQIRDLTPLKTLTNLTSLILLDNPISDITPLTSLPRLNALYLGSRFGNNSSISDISPVAEMAQLRNLSIYGAAEVRDISPLAKLTGLYRLVLKRNNISDITPLLGLRNLNILDLSDNQISDVSPLTGLVKLQELHLLGNPIKNRKPLLELLRKNPDVKIYITDKNGREKLLPVTLSHFQAEHTNAGIVIKWTTESEVDNAGFYIYRSETKDGEFKVVNPTMIQGAGTTGERNVYTWTDTTAKPNTVYYYQIEDVSHAGVREQLATVRLKGFMSAKDKLLLKWGDLKHLRQ